MSSVQESLQFDRASLPLEVDDFCSDLCTALRRADSFTARSIAISRLRESLRDSNGPDSLKKIRSLFLRHVLLDLSSQGWSVKLTQSRLTVVPPDKTGESMEVAKERIRRQHLQERDAQLREPSVRQFISGMERRRLTTTGWHSIFSVMRDGEELASRLRAALEISDASKRAQYLSMCIDPYIQLVDSAETCSQTGLKLIDIWRYFRHTWTNAYRSIPGRSMAILIRDRAAPNHPVIGIAALGSSVVQQSIRDAWIGWDSKSIVEDFCSDASRSKAEWLLDRIESQIQGIYIRDLKRDGLITRQQIRKPGIEDIAGLREEADKAIKRHRLFPDKDQLKHNGQGTNWRLTAETDLFRSKRCNQLAVLLSVRKAIQDVGLDRLTGNDLRNAMRSPSIRHAVSQVFRRVKAETVGISMMDITVCGAVAPYNAILGGKLVCLLLCSPEIIRLYQDRYTKQVSVIASSMAGSEVSRRPKLVLLCTTSLYGGGSSQYNRLKVPPRAFGDYPTGQMEYMELGMSEGFGSFHFSKETIRSADALLGRLDHGRKVNSIFGEGVNPLMRKMREAMSEVGLPSELLLKHGNRRIVYGIALAENFREVLTGLASRPRYLLPPKQAEALTRSLADFWRSRWLSMRIQRDGILNDVSQHTLSFPIRHGAVVELPAGDVTEDGYLSPRLGS